MVDFLTIVKLGNLVGAVSPPLADRFAVPLAICRDVAEGKEVPAARLLEGQRLAAHWWADLGLALVQLGFPVGGVAAVLHSSRTGRHVAAGVLLALGFMVACAASQVVTQSLRYWGTLHGMRRMGGRAVREPLPSDSFGLPKPRDFWVAAAVAAAGAGVLLYAAIRARGFG